MMLLTLLAALASGPPELWAGHQVLFGERALPILGDLATRSDTYVLAELSRRADGLVLTQRACAVEMAPVSGVTSTMSTPAVRALPAVRMRLVEATDPSYPLAGTWVSGWDHRDVDRDGKPGMTIHVGGTICAGEIYMATNGVTVARAADLGTSLVGEVEVRVSNELLGASNICLRMGAPDGPETMRGVFRYVRVPPGTSCNNFDATKWPAKAD